MLNPSLRCAVVLSPWLALAGAELLPQQEDRKARLGIVGVVGTWTEQLSDGEMVITADGPANPAPPPVADVERIAQALFGRPDPAFTANATAAGAFSLGVLPQTAMLTQGTFRAKFRLVSGAGDQTAGLVFGLKHSGEYLFVRYNTKDGNVALWRYANGQRARLADGERSRQLGLGGWHDLAVTIAGTRIVGTASTDLRLEHDLKQDVSGRVGFWTKRDSVTMFKDITIEPTR